MKQQQQQAQESTAKEVGKGKELPQQREGGSLDASNAGGLPKKR